MPDGLTNSASGAFVIAGLVIAVLAVVRQPRWIRAVRNAEQPLAGLPRERRRWLRRQVRAGAPLTGEDAVPGRATAQGMALQRRMLLSQVANSCICVGMLVQFSRDSGTFSTVLIVVLAAGLVTTLVGTAIALSNARAAERYLAR